MNISPTALLDVIYMTPHERADLVKNIRVLFGADQHSLTVHQKQAMSQSVMRMVSGTAIHCRELCNRNVMDAIFGSRMTLLQKNTLETVAHMLTIARECKLVPE